MTSVRLPSSCVDRVVNGHSEEVVMTACWDNSVYILSRDTSDEWQSVGALELPASPIAILCTTSHIVIVTFGSVHVYVISN